MKKSTVLVLTTLLIPSFLLAGDLEAFGTEMSKFYMSPDKQKFEEFQSKAEKLEKELFEKRNKSGLLVAVVVAKISEKHSWPISGKGKVSTLASEIAEGKTDLAKYIANDKKVDPGKLDVWWCSYFATGEASYLDKILVYAGEKNPPKDMNMMIVGPATWSFKSNCKQHEAIKQYAKTCIEQEKYKHKVEYLKECIK